MNVRNEMEILCLFSSTIHPDLLPMQTWLFILLLLTSSIAAIIITTATRGHQKNVNMGCDKLLSQATWLLVALLINSGKVCRQKKKKKHVQKG